MPVRPSVGVWSARWWRTARCGRSSTRRRVWAERVRLARVVPGLQLRERVDEAAPGVDPPAAQPLLEVQMGASGVAGAADAADGRAGGHDLARLGAERALLAVGEEERPAISGLLDDVVARAAGLVARDGDRAADGGDDRRAGGGGEVLALVRVTVARRADAVAVGVRAGDREHAARDHAADDRYGRWHRRGGRGRRRRRGDYERRAARGVGEALEHVVEAIACMDPDEVGARGEL